MSTNLVRDECASASRPHTQLLLFHFNKDWNSSINFNKTPQIKISLFSRFSVSVLLKIHEEINKLIFGATSRFQRNIISFCSLCCGLYQRASLEWMFIYWEEYSETRNVIACSQRLCGNWRNYFSVASGK